MVFDARLVSLILSLGLDTFALSTALGVAPLPARTRLRLALTFATAEGLCPRWGCCSGVPWATPSAPGPPISRLCY
jgi:putative Mn2+ efflux pump MntP